MYALNHEIVFEVNHYLLIAFYNALLNSFLDIKVYHFFPEITILKTCFAISIPLR